MERSRAIPNSEVFGTRDLYAGAALITQKRRELATVQHAADCRRDLGVSQNRGCPRCRLLAQINIIRGDA